MRGLNNSEIVLVHIIHNLAGGGLERRMLELIKKLDLDTTFSQYLIILNNTVDYPEIYNTRTKLIIYNDGYDYNKPSLKAIRKISNTLQIIKPNIVHVWTSSLSGIIAAFLNKSLLKYKLVIGNIADANPVKPIFIRLINKISYHYADCIVSNSYAGINAKKAPFNKCKVIYNGFSFERFSNFSLYDKFEIKKEFGINTKFVVSMNARFITAKDWQTFFNIASAVSKQRYDVTFLAVGKGELLSFYQNVVETMGLRNVIFTGFRNDIDKIYYISDVCILCTNAEVHAEGVSNSIMEAMACGLPVIATNGGGTSEIILDKKNGIIIPPKDYKSGTQELIKLLSEADLRKKIGQAAYETIVAKFTIDEMTSNYKNLYYQLLS